MAKTSAGVLLFRRHGKGVEVLLGHPGGPFWAKKDQGAWSIPKGEFADEDPLTAAKREFKEETGHDVPMGECLELGVVKIPSKTIHCWAVEGDMDVTTIRSNTFEMEWPPKSGEKQAFPEIDKAAWVDITKAPAKMHKGQSEFIERLAQKLDLKIQEPPKQASLF